LAVVKGLEKFSFHSNPKEEQCQRIFKLPQNWTHLICYKVNVPNPSTGTLNITESGDHNVTAYATAHVAVQQGITPTGTLEITENGDNIDVAQYAYKLWPDKDEDSARSYFYKCLDGKTNDTGDVYKFTSDEINRLYSMLANDEL
jgi:hypothetical protein